MEGRGGMNDRLQAELARIAGSDQESEAFRQMGVLWAKFFRAAVGEGMSVVEASLLTRDCFDRWLRLAYEARP